MSVTVIPGFFYAIQCNSAIDGYRICRVMASLEGEFQGLLYRKSSSLSLDDICFEETICSFVLDLKAVMSQLVSAHCDGKFLHVNSVEIEELLVSSLMNS